MTLAADPRPQDPPDHAHDDRGGLLPDPRCFWCQPDAEQVGEVAGSG
jgi:hypothetical protein